MLRRVLVIVFYPFRVWSVHPRFGIPEWPKPMRLVVETYFTTFDADASKRLGSGSLSYARPVAITLRETMNGVGFVQVTFAYDAVTT